MQNIFFYYFIWYQRTEKILEEVIENYLPSVISWNTLYFSKIPKNIFLDYQKINKTPNSLD